MACLTVCIKDRVPSRTRGVDKPHFSVLCSRHLNFLFKCFFLYLYIHVIYKSWLLGVTEVIINYKIPMTEVEGTVLVEYHHVTMIYMVYTIVCGCAIIVFAVCLCVVSS